MDDHDEAQQDPIAADVSWRGLDGMLDSHYRDLDPVHARVFRLLGLHPVPEFGTPAVAALATLDDASAARALEALAREHLIERATPDRRYRMHPVVHDYARFRAEQDEEPARRREAVAAVLEWYAAMADLADRLVYPVSSRLPVDLPLAQPPTWDREQALQWLRSERAALSAAQRTALDHGMHTVVMAMAVSSRHLGLGPRTWWAQALEATSRGIEAARVSEDPAAEAFLRVLRGHCHRGAGDLTAAQTDFRHVSTAAARSGDAVLRRRAVAGLASLSEARGRHDEAAAHYLEMLEATRQEPDVAAEAVALGNLCLVHVKLGRFDEALDYGLQAWELRSRTGDPLVTAYAEDDLARVRQGLGEHETAIALWEKVVAVYARHGGAESHLAAALEAMAVSLAALGRDRQAAHTLRRAADLLTSLGDPRADLVSARADGPDRP